MLLGMAPPKLLVSNDNNIAHCDRCGDPCKVNPNRNPDARMLRHAAEPKGFCVNCAVTQWFMNMEETIPMKDLPNALRAKPVQEQFCRLIQSANADAKPEEINWTKVVEHWALPFPKPPKKSRSKKAKKGATPPTLPKPTPDRSLN